MNLHFVINDSAAPGDHDPYLRRVYDPAALLNYIADGYRHRD
ncbi:hypothetical protein ETAE_3019 [Edwardsiella piscicida]|uniref:Uncharacterized protein n=3 Tax=Edwardsiella TaxID=635 RepID=A0A0H3DTL2_EDWTF|nr:hypothetical protein ETAE_3019 [Edwardsiella tarda EIB202]ADM42851.1 hypothetical protein ETAF_2747 [Edwardsiella tarda FL6-60]AIJ07710.1 Hypothetical protein ETEE_1253 [Edwardsiella anguillarum ET080813]